MIGTVSNKIRLTTNQEGPRVGKGVKIYRDRLGYTLEKMAKSINVEPSFYESLENGYLLVVDRRVLEDIAELAGVSRRYNRLPDDKLLDLFTCATADAPPRLI